MVIVLVRGDHRLNEIKLRNALGADFRQAHAEEIAERVGPAGFIGPVGHGPAGHQGRRDRRRLGYVCGANRPDTHLRGVEPGRDFAYEEMDVRVGRGGRHSRPAAIRSRSSRRSRSATSSSSARATRSRLAPTILDEDGTERPIMMGSYGIGPARIGRGGDRAARRRAGDRLAAADRPLGRSSRLAWRRPVTRSAEAADRLYEELESAGLAVVYDDREAGAGEKLTDAELLGCPLRLVVGRRGLADEVVEAQRAPQRCRRPARCGRGGEPRRRAPRRPGADAPSGQQAPPLRPRPFWPEAIGDAARATAPSAARSRTSSATSAWRRIPVFLYLALSSSDGRTAASAIVYLAIAAE